MFRVQSCFFFEVQFYKSDKICKLLNLSLSLCFGERQKPPVIFGRFTAFLLIISATGAVIVALCAQAALRNALGVMPVWA